MGEVEGLESQKGFLKRHWEGYKEFWGERFSFLDSYSRFIKLDKPLPSWSSADVEEFIASDPVHGPAVCITAPCIFLSLLRFEFCCLFSTLCFSGFGQYSLFAFSFALYGIHLCSSTASIWVFFGKKKCSGGIHILVNFSILDSIYFLSLTMVFLRVRCSWIRFCWNKASIYKFEKILNYQNLDASYEFFCLSSKLLYGIYLFFQFSFCFLINYFLPLIS